MDTTIQTERDKGFTLIELLIVIVILGILATITVFAVNGITSNARTNACDADEKTIEVAIEAYAAENDLANSNNVQTADVTPYVRDWPTGWTVVNGVITRGGDCT